MCTMRSLFKFSLFTCMLSLACGTEGIEADSSHVAVEAVHNAGLDVHDQRHGSNRHRGKRCEAPPHRGYAGMVSDIQKNRVLLLGGFTQLGFVMDILDIWEFDVARRRWTQISDEFTPLDYDTLALDTKNRKVIVYNPFAGAGLDVQTWAYDIDSGEWDEMTPAVQPPTRWGSRMVYDGGSEKMVLFGGGDNLTGLPLNDTWTYDYETNTWNELVTDASPDGRNYFGLEYVPSSRFDAWFPRLHGVIMHGDVMYDANGDPTIFDIVSRTSDMWHLDVANATWTKVETKNTPEPVGYVKLAFDARRQSLMMFGGVVDHDNWPEEATLDDTWTFNLYTKKFRKLRPRHSPSARSWHDTVATRRGVMIFGGGPSRFEYTNETWNFAGGSWNFAGGSWYQVAKCD